MHTKQDTIVISAFDRILEILAISALFGSFLIPVLYFTAMPERIPMHFNAQGQADRMGSKYALFMVPLIGLALYTLLTALGRSPQLYNYPVKITAENKSFQYGLAVRFIRLLKTVLMLLLAALTMMLSAVAMGSIKNLGVGFLPLFFIAIISPIVWYVSKAYKGNRTK